MTFILPAPCYPTCHDSPSGRITAIILTFNEAIHLERCLSSLSTLTSDIVVVDSFSSDATLSIAHRFNARIYQRAFITQADQFQWALENVEISTPWILRIDADEYLEEDLQQTLHATLSILPETVVGINLKRKHIFMDRWIRHGGRYPLVLLRIWRAGHGRIEKRWMDEHVLVSGGSIVTIDGGFVDHNLNDLAYFISKHNGYATREAMEVLNRRFSFYEVSEAIDKSNTSAQAAIKRLMKNRLYSRLPFFLAPALYFLYRYIILVGFLDGKEGLIYHFMQGFWYRFLVEAKVLEFERALSRCRSLSERQTTIEKLIGRSFKNLVDKL